jgi:hypothetical protein
MSSTAQPLVSAKGPGWSVVWTLYASGLDGGSVVIVPKNWTINRSRREPLDWTVTLPYTSELRRLGTIGQYLRPEPYDENWTLLRYLVCVITVGEDTWTSPKLVLKSRRIGVSKGQKVLTLRGSDRTEALLEEDVIEEDVRSETDALITCKEAVEETLNNQGISSVSQTYTDFNVKTFHRAGVPLSYLRELLETVQATFYWDGDTFTINQGGRSVGEETADYTLTEGENVIVLDYQEDAGSAPNEIYVERTSELKNGIAEPIKGRALGGVTITLDIPAFAAYINIELDAPGYTGDWTWDDEEGTPLTMAPTKVFRGETTKAAQVRFNIYPPEGSGSLDEIGYTVTILIDDTPDEFGDYESTVFATAISTFDQSKRGKKKLPQPITVQHVPNQTIAQLCADLILAEKLRGYSTVQIQAPLRPLVRPDLVGAITSEELEFDGFNMMTERVDFNGTEKSILMTVSLSREMVDLEA